MKPTFRIHPLCYVILLITFLTGYFKDIMIFMAIILIHEIGHIIVAIILNWKIKEIIILPMGGVTIFNEVINKPLKEEFFIAIGGPLFQIVITFILNLFMYNELFNYYSLIILIINLLPIYPLDGSKIMNVLINKIFSFKLSHKILIISSLLITGALIIINIVNINLIYILFLLLIIIKIKEEIVNHYFIFEKFLYERYLYNFKFKKFKIIPNIYKFKRDYYHYVKNDNNIIDETLILKKKFDFNK